MGTGFLIVGAGLIAGGIGLIIKEIAQGIHADWLCSQIRMRLKLTIAMRALDYGDIDRRSQQNRNFVQAGMDMKAYRRARK